MSGHRPEADCTVVHARMYEFFDGELDEPTLTVIQAHLEACEGCVESYDAEQKMRLVVRRCCAEPAPAELRARIQVLRATLTRGTDEA